MAEHTLTLAAELRAQCEVTRRLCEESRGLRAAMREVLGR
jgi:hypothetical protein